MAARACARSRGKDPLDPADIAGIIHGVMPALGAPVALSNDVNVATQAEFELGAAKPYRSILGVFWGTGVGGGIVLNGRIFRGAGFFDATTYPLIQP